MRTEDCIKCPYVEARKKNYYCTYRKTELSGGVLRKFGLENIKNITKCYIQKGGRK